jgi:uncharacterized protein DUF4349
MLSRRHLLVVSVAAVTVSLLAACSGSATVADQRGAASSSLAYGAAAAPVQHAPGAGQSTGAAGGSPMVGDGSATLDIGQPQGQIERRVDASFRVDHGTFQAAFDSVVSHATSLGGFVTESSTEPDADGRISSGSVTVRVPAAKLSDLVSGLPSSFRLSSVNYSSIDHTSESVDLAARLSAATGHRDALEQLLAKAQGLTDITGLEDQIAQVQQQIDQLQGQADAVKNAVQLSTARIGITEDGIAAPPPPPGPSPMLDALHTGWSNAVSVVSAVVLGVLTVLPLIVLAVPLLLAAWWVRRSAGGRAAPPA